MFRDTTFTGRIITYRGQVIPAICVIYGYTAYVTGDDPHAGGIAGRESAIGGTVRFAGAALFTNVSWAQACLAGHSHMTSTDHGEVVLAHAVAAYAEALGSRLVACYALGSLAHGGFSPLVSDVDLGLILRDPLRASDRLTIRKVAGAVRAGGPALHERLSVFWGTPSTLAGQARGGRFPPLDRLDLLEYGRLLTGRDVRDRVARPEPSELLVAGAEFALGYLGGPRNLPDRVRNSAWRRSSHDDALAEIRAPALLVSRGPRRLTKIVLFPVRFLFTARTGRVGTNSLAADHYLSSADAPATELVTTALAWRLEPPADNDTAAALVGRELIPLYLHYIDDHIARLAGADRQALADRFRQWRARLLA
jgi:hypothetical protein